MITEAEFNALAAKGYNRIPLVLETFADLDTPLSLYLKLAHQLASSPWGRDARSTAPGAEQSATPYGLLFDAMARANALSASRLGSR